ncbi:S-methyl-5'-thioadenosine phosphorylase [Ruminiclostridium hungatei]|uniref:Purine nucleoside phosphorylase n=2 Tax=Ruminiclostridium hungatei TaxID=48256 RepID=A0A1V4SPK9_RUMHU|nr:S-methyl-5'-thioadenosine phosphorylase [Ruminiclostridium hungatei]
MENIDIGIFGGSGLYSFSEDFEERELDTPYGKPSGPVSIGNCGGVKVAFLPRHGKEHHLPPHLIPYRANIYAMKQLGVKKILAPTASGSLKAEIKPGDFVICDQFVDRTSGRRDTFFEGPAVRHISSAYPYCPELRKLAAEIGRSQGVTIHEKGTVVVIQGPRFSTVAESRWYGKMGWEVINMTQYPECYLARELGICYVNISLITDFDAGLEGDTRIKPVSEQEVFKVFNENNEKVKTLLFEMIRQIGANAGGFACAHCGQ